LHLYGAVGAGHGRGMTDTPPDRIAAHPSSPFYNAELLERGIGVRFKGAERNDVDEYCVSESWIRVALGKKVDRKGAALTLKLTGPAEVWFRDAPDALTSAPAEPLASPGE
jgi:hypothetical protein